MATTIKWDAFRDIDAPCADISYKWWAEEEARLTVVMHFSGVIGGYPADLELTFRYLLALQWEQESFDFIDLPEPLPKCASSGFSNWTYPMLIVKNSEWAELYANRKYSSEDPRINDITHYAFISLCDILHVLSEDVPSARFLERRDAQ